MSVAPAGCAVTEQLSVIVPAYPLVELAVTLDEIEPPGATVAGVAHCNFMEEIHAETLMEAAARRFFSPCGEYNSVTEQYS